MKIAYGCLLGPEFDPPQVHKKLPIISVTKHEVCERFKAAFKKGKPLRAVNSADRQLSRWRNT